MIQSGSRALGDELKRKLNCTVYIEEMPGKNALAWAIEDQSVSKTLICCFFDKTTSYILYLSSFWGQGEDAAASRACCLVAHFAETQAAFWRRFPFPSAPAMQHNTEPCLQLTGWPGAGSILGAEAGWSTACFTFRWDWSGMELRRST